MRHALFAILAGLSLIMCVATCVLWARSYWGSDYLERRWLSGADATAVEHQSQGIQFTHGEIRFVLAKDMYFHRGRADVRMTRAAAQPHWYWGRIGVGHVGWESPVPKSVANRLGFAEWESNWISSFSDSQDRIWSAPAWLAAFFFAVLPGLWTSGALGRRRRWRAGWCRHQPRLARREIQIHRPRILLRGNRPPRRRPRRAPSFARAGCD